MYVLSLYLALMQSINRSNLSFFHHLDVICVRHVIGKYSIRDKYSLTQHKNSRVKSHESPTKWTHFGLLSATVGVTLLHYLRNILN